MAVIEGLGNQLTSSKHFNQLSSVFWVQIVYGGGDSNIITLLGRNGAPNKTYIEFTPAQHTERNFINQASTLFSGVSESPQGCDEKEDPTTSSHRRGGSCARGT